MILYVVEMLRWGSAENHSYVLGVYSDLELADRSGEQETMDRGGKYEFQITQMQLDTENQFNFLKRDEGMCSKKCSETDCNLKNLFKKTK